MDLHVMCENRVTWANVAAADIVLMLRPFTEEQFHIGLLTKQMNRKLWVDYDDNLFCLPESNPCHRIYNDTGVQYQISRLCSLADILTVSTSGIQEELKKFNASTIVLPNSIPTHLFPKLPFKEERSNVVMWRGSDTHMADLLAVKDELNQLIGLHPEVEFSFMGITPWFLDKKPNISSFKDIDVVKYFHAIYETAPILFINPLEDHKFNRCKSNICWQEAAWAGAPLVMTGMGVWQNALDGNGKFVEAVDALIKNREVAANLGKQCHGLLADLAIEKINMTRRDIIFALRD